MSTCYQRNANVTPPFISTNILLEASADKAGSLETHRVATAWIFGERQVHSVHSMCIATSRTD